MPVINALDFFVPYLVLSLALSMLLGLSFQKQFNAGAWWRGALLGFGFLSMFAIFGVVVAYFLSLGIAEKDNHIGNPLVDQFATPFIALLTGAVGYVASKQSPSETPLAVPIGVVCFLVTTIVCYKAMFAAAAARIIAGQPF